MRALVCRQHGGLEQLALEELPEPEPGPGQVRVAVHAASVNFPDVLIVKDAYQVSAPTPFSPGSEFAGVVEALGPGVDALAVGDRVMGAVFVGAFAEAVCTDAAGLQRIPEGVSFEAAAAFSVVYSTAYGCLVSTAKLLPGETLVVLGAAGGVGLAAVELGVLLGAEVIAVASSPEKLAACREAGAGAGIDYAKEDLKQRIRELTGGRGADVVLDPVGGSATQAALRALAWHGRLVIAGFAAGEIPQLPANLVLLKGASVMGFEMGGFMARDTDQAAAMRSRLQSWLADGSLRPRTRSVFALDDAVEALREVEARRAIGKVIVQPR